MSRRWLLLVLAGCAARPVAPPSVTPAVVGYGFTSSGSADELSLLSALGFSADTSSSTRAPAPGTSGTTTTYRLGTESLSLTVPSGVTLTPVPPDSRSNDGWFQHVAIVVSDLDEAYRRAVAAGAATISRGGPQTIPLSNPAAGGIRAVYLKDPDGHALELIWYPEGKGQPRWQRKDALFLGLDHSAIASADTARSVAFYSALGLAVAGNSLNQGPEQEALSGVSGAVVRITGLKGLAGPGVELLEYLKPGPGRPYPSSSTAADLVHWETTIAVSDVAAAAAAAQEAGGTMLSRADGQALLADPDGHRVRLVAR